MDLDSVSSRKVLLLVGFGVMAIVIIPILILVLYSQSRNNMLDSILDKITPYPNSVLVFHDDEANSPAAGSISCGTIHRIELYGTHASSAEVIKYFETQFKDKGWTEEEEGLFAIDEKTHVVVSAVENAMSMVSFGMATSDFENVKDRYGLLYRIYVFNELKEDCA